jgi:hypothetical protein
VELNLRFACLVEGLVADFWVWRRIIFAFGMAKGENHWHCPSSDK